MFEQLQDWIVCEDQTKYIVHSVRFHTTFTEIISQVIPTSTNQLHYKLGVWVIKTFLRFSTVKPPSKVFIGETELVLYFQISVLLVVLVPALPGSTYQFS